VSAASITYDTSATDATTRTDNGTIPFSLTVASAAGQDRLLILTTIGPGGIVDYDAVTVNGVSATRVGVVARGATEDNSNCALLTAYRVAGTASTSLSVVATIDCPGGGNVYGGICACFRLSAGSLLAQTSVQGIYGGVSSDPTLDTNTVSGGAILAVDWVYDSNKVHAWTGATERFDSVTCGYGDSLSAATANIVTGQTPRPISLARTNNVVSDSESAIAVVLSFDAVSDGGGGGGGAGIRKSSMVGIGRMMGR
jgi:hypothetical protein